MGRDYAVSDDVKKRIKIVLTENLPGDVTSRELENDTPLLDLGVGVDSVSRLELLVALEEEFRIKLDESEITPGFFETIDSISHHISQKLNVS